ncbi:hypothetical protein GGQ87_000347 [Brevundimonas alba]|uniref:DUF4440 domain-containing protein n=1 Tax=Brevundimonas alba TaxID=74314 RepID=A0A7X5YK10_9CAUL|nr:DUF4440 domain-containing protein [Brevundimonas alba]NJC40089.1 hypothetical protein [Brevundimonas alba]
MRAIVPAVLAIVLAAAHPAAAQTAPAAAWGEPAADLPAFMEAYAESIRAGDREAMIARYDPAGAWMVSAGRGEHLDPGEIADIYRSDAWQAPQAFEWQGLAYIPTGPDAVTVTGRFVWTPSDGVGRTIAYHGQFVRVDGAWRIRVEDETPVAASR